MFFGNLVSRSHRREEFGPWLTATPDFAVFVNHERTAGAKFGAFVAFFECAGKRGKRNGVNHMQVVLPEGLWASGWAKSAIFGVNQR
jgi:hypothetical protein